MITLCWLHHVLSAFEFNKKRGVILTYLFQHLAWVEYCQWLVCGAYASHLDQHPRRCPSTCAAAFFQRLWHSDMRRKQWLNTIHVMYYYSMHVPSIILFSIISDTRWNKGEDRKASQVLHVENENRLFGDFEFQVLSTVFPKVACISSQQKCARSNPFSASRVCSEMVRFCMWP